MTTAVLYFLFLGFGSAVGSSWNFKKCKYLSLVTHSTTKSKKKEDGKWKIIIKYKKGGKIFLQIYFPWSLNDHRINRKKYKNEQTASLK